MDSAFSPQSQKLNVSSRQFHWIAEKTTENLSIHIKKTKPFIGEAYGVQQKNRLSISSFDEWKALLCTCLESVRISSWDEKIWVVWIVFSLNLINSKMLDWFRFLSFENHEEAVWRAAYENDNWITKILENTKRKDQRCWWKLVNSLRLTSLPVFFRLRQPERLPLLRTTTNSWYRYANRWKIIWLSEQMSQVFSWLLLNLNLVIHIINVQKARIVTDLLYLFAPRLTVLIMTKSVCTYTVRISSSHHCHQYR